MGSLSSNHPCKIQACITVFLARASVTRKISGSATTSSKIYFSAPFSSGVEFSIRLSHMNSISSEYSIVSATFRRYRLLVKTVHRILRVVRRAYHWTTVHLSRSFWHFPNASQIYQPGDFEILDIFSKLVYRSMHEKLLGMISFTMCNRLSLELFMLEVWLGARYFNLIWTFNFFCWRSWLPLSQTDATARVCRLFFFFFDKGPQIWVTEPFVFEKNTKQVKRELLHKFKWVWRPLKTKNMDI